MTTSKHLSPILASLINLAALCACGASIGWMVGMSVTPVVQKVLEGVLGIAVAIIAALAGVRELSLEASDQDDSRETLEKERSVNSRPQRREARIEVTALPLAAFSLFLAIGATNGLEARISDRYSPDPKTFVNRWQALTGSDRTILAKLLLESEYPDLPQVELRSEVKKKFPEWINFPVVEKEKLAETLLSLAYRQSGRDVSSDESSSPEVKAKGKAEQYTAPSVKAAAQHEGTGLKNSPGQSTNPCQQVQVQSHANQFNFEVQVKNTFEKSFASCVSSGKDDKTCAREVMRRQCPHVEELHSH